ncbi:hypothetical protein KCU65_g5663, partial [Aureobasidium melanogenum]
MADTNNTAPPGNAVPEPLIFSGRPASPTPSDTASVASRDSGLGPSLFSSNGNDNPDPEENSYSDDYDSDASASTEDANPPAAPVDLCPRQDCLNRLADQMARVNILEQFVQLRARHYTGELHNDLQNAGRPPRTMHEQIQDLEEKGKEIQELLAESRRAKEVMTKREAEMDERIVECGRVLDTIQEKEEILANNMKSLDKRLQLVKKEEADLAKRKKELELRQKTIEQDTTKLGNSQKTFAKQSSMLSNLLRKQHDTKTALDNAKETLEAHENSVMKRDVAVTQREVAVAQREVAVAKREYIMVQREKALLEHEQAVHRFVAQHQQSEQEFKQRMQFLMQQSLEGAVADLPSEKKEDAPEHAEEQESEPEEVTSASHAPEATTSPQPSPHVEAPVPSSMIPPVRQRRDLYGRPDSRLTRRTR